MVAAKIYGVYFVCNQYLTLLTIVKHDYPAHFCIFAILNRNGCKFCLPVPAAEYGELYKKSLIDAYRDKP